MRSRFVVSVCTLACATNTPRRDVVRARPEAAHAVATVRAPSSRGAPTAVSTAGTARPRQALEFVITGRSDLPTRASTAQPYERIVEATLTGLRRALAGCLRTRGTPTRWVLRVILEADGTMRERSLQGDGLSSDERECVTEVLRGTVLDPPPPRSIPYDLWVDLE